MNIKHKVEISFPPAKEREVDVLALTLRTVNLLKTQGGYSPAIKEGQAAFAACPQGVQAAYYSQLNGALFVRTASAVYRLNSGAEEWAEVGAWEGQEPFFVDMYINTLPATTMFCGTSRIVYTGYVQNSAQDTNTLSCAAAHCGRLFGIDLSNPLKLVWAASHPLDWMEGIYGSGHIFLPPEGGPALRLFSYKDRLIVVRRRGVTVVHAYGEPQHYKVDSTANHLVAGGIIAQTCAVCNGAIFFCTESELFCFDGDSVNLLARLNDCGIYAPLCAAACAHQYVLMCTDGQSGQACLYVFDAELSQGCVCAVQPQAVFEGPDGVYAVLGTRICRLCAGGEGVWYSQTLGGARMFVRSVEVLCDGDVGVEVYSRGVGRTLSGSGRHVVNMCGDSFEFVVRAGGLLRKLCARAEVQSAV